MARRFIIADPSEDVQLMLSQYISIGWHDAEIEEETIKDLLAAERVETDVIIVGETSSNDPNLHALLKRSDAGEIPPVIIINNEGNEFNESSSMNAPVLSMEDITPVNLNGIIAEALKQQADGVIKQRKKSKKDSEKSHEDNEIPTEKLEGLKGYRIIRELGRGGMSRVLLAEDLDDGKEVAIKVLDTKTIEDERMIERFIREYAILSSVDNPHVVKIYDQTFTDQYAFIIMQRFPGGDLTRRIRKGIRPDQAIRYLVQIARGLEAVHEEGIVHRDLKPGNILFYDNTRLALVDFGLSQTEDDSTDLTRHGEVYGTPSYVSPEQARGRRVDQRSDIYSAGIIFYQMLTREKPYRADNPMAMFYKHVHAELPMLPGEFSEYQSLLDKMLAKSPDDRFQSASELAQALQEYMQ